MCRRCMFSKQMGDGFHVGIQRKLVLGVEFDVKHVCRLTFIKVATVVGTKRMECVFAFVEKWCG